MWKYTTKFYASSETTLQNGKSNIYIFMNEITLALSLEFGEVWVCKKVELDWENITENTQRHKWMCVCVHTHTHVHKESYLPAYWKASQCILQW